VVPPPEPGLAPGSGQPGAVPGSAASQPMVVPPAPGSRSRQVAGGAASDFNRRLIETTEVLFRCGTCSRFIAESRTVYMHRGKSYCSKQCRRKGSKSASLPIACGGGLSASKASRTACGTLLAGPALQPPSGLAKRRTVSCEQLCPPPSVGGAVAAPFAALPEGGVAAKTHCEGTPGLFRRLITVMCTAISSILRLLIEVFMGVLRDCFAGDEEEDWEAQEHQKIRRQQRKSSALKEQEVLSGYPLSIWSDVSDVEEDDESEADETEDEDEISWPSPLQLQRHGCVEPGSPLSPHQPCAFLRGLSEVSTQPSLSFSRTTSEEPGYESTNMEFGVEENIVRRNKVQCQPLSSEFK